MNSGAIMIFVICCALALGNFAYQALTGDPHWWVAAERSYFSAVGAGLTWLYLRGQLRAEGDV